MKFLYAVILIFLSALSLVARAACDKCNLSSEHCPCREAETLFESMNHLVGNAGESSMSAQSGSAVESDGIVRVETPGATVTIIDDENPNRFFRFPTENHYHSLQQPPFNPHYMPDAFSSLPQVPAPGGLSHLSAVAVGNTAMANANSARPEDIISGNEFFHGPDRHPRPSNRNFNGNTNQPVPTVEQSVLSQQQYLGYSTVDWRTILEKFAEARKKINQLNEINENIGLLYKEAKSPEEQQEVQRQSEQTHRPYSEDEARILMDLFQTNLQVVLGHTAQESDLHSLVIPIETSNSLAWAVGNFKYVYKSLFDLLLKESGDINVKDFFRHLIQIRRQVLAFSRNHEPPESDPYFSISENPDSIISAQAVSELLVNHINHELRQGFRSFAFRYSGRPSPYNQGTLFLFVFQGAAIIISPHLGIMMSHNIDDIVHYIINYTLILSVNRISDRVHIGRI